MVFIFLQGKNILVYSFLIEIMEEDTVLYALRDILCIEAETPWSESRLVAVSLRPQVERGANHFNFLFEFNYLTRLNIK